MKDYKFNEYNTQTFDLINQIESNPYKESDEIIDPKIFSDILQSIKGLLCCKSKKAISILLYEIFRDLKKIKDFKTFQIPQDMLISTASHKSFQSVLMQLVKNPKILKKSQKRAINIIQILIESNIIKPELLLDEDIINLLRELFRSRCNYDGGDDIPLLDYHGIFIFYRDIVKISQEACHNLIEFIPVSQIAQCFLNDDDPELDCLEIIYYLSQYPFVINSEILEPILQILSYAIRTKVENPYFRRGIILYTISNLLFNHISNFNFFLQEPFWSFIVDHLEPSLIKDQDFTIRISGSVQIINSLLDILITTKTEIFSPEEWSKICEKLIILYSSPIYTATEEKIISTLTLLIKYWPDAIQIIITPQVSQPSFFHILLSHWDKSSHSTKLLMSSLLFVILEQMPTQFLQQLLLSEPIIQSFFMDIFEIEDLDQIFNLLNLFLSITEKCDQGDVRVSLKNFLVEYHDLILEIEFNDNSKFELVNQTLNSLFSILSISL